jgi:hypothetical protein
VAGVSEPKLLEIFAMIFGKKPSRKAPEPLVLATQSEPFISLNNQQAVITSTQAAPLVRQFSNPTGSYVKPAYIDEVPNHKVSPITVILCFIAVSALATVAYRWVMKDPWNPPAAVLTAQKIGDFGLGVRNALPAPTRPRFNIARRSGALAKTRLQSRPLLRSTI